MRIVLATTLLAIAASLAAKPLPRFALSTRIQIPRFSVKRKIRNKMSFEEKLQFIFNLKSQLHSGVNQAAAIKYAIDRAPIFAFENTKQALESEAKVIPALHKDSVKDQFPLLVRCANLLDLSSSSGSSISEALTQVANKLMNRRIQEQLIMTELASTKATVMVLAGLPIIGVAMGLILGANSISWLLGTGMGQICLGFGIALEVVGWLWIKKLLSRALADAT